MKAIWKELGLPGPMRPKVNGKRIIPNRIYRVWQNMMKRSGCHCRKSYSRQRSSKYYAHVKVCDDWRDFRNFYRWAMSHGYRDGLTIDRIDWRRGYRPENCRWATYLEQNRHRRPWGSVSRHGKLVKP